MTASTPALGASVGELLDQAEHLLYAIAAGSSSGNRLLAAWPSYAATCARLTAAAVGPRYTGQAAVIRRADTDPVLLAGLRLDAHIGAMSVNTNGVLPDPAMTRVTQLIGAAADLIECAHDRPGVIQREAAQADSTRTAGVVRAAELTLTGADVTIRACGRTHQQHPATAPNRPRRLTSRTTPLFTTRRLAADLLDAAASRPPQGALDYIRVPTVGSVRPGDLLDRLQATLAPWRQLSLEAGQSPAVSSAEMQRATVEARHVIALGAALTDAARASGHLPAEEVILRMAQLQRVGSAWSVATVAWTRFTTGIMPSQQHVDVSLELQAAIRAISRADNGAWLTPDGLPKRVDLSSALDVLRGGLAAVVDIARAHDDAVKRIVRMGAVFAHARSVPLTDERLTARLRGHHVPITVDEAAPLRLGYRRAVVSSEAVYRSAASQVRHHEPSVRSRVGHVTRTGVEHSQSL